MLKKEKKKRFDKRCPKNLFSEKVPKSAQKCPCKVQKNEKVPNDYMKTQLKHLDIYEGNIDTLANRISNVRTWSYVANKKNWAENSDYWIERSKYIEDKLSDKLHEELI